MLRFQPLIRKHPPWEVAIILGYCQIKYWSGNMNQARNCGQTTEGLDLSNDVTLTSLGQTWGRLKFESLWEKIATKIYLWLVILVFLLRPGKSACLLTRSLSVALAPRLNLLKIINLLRKYLSNHSVINSNSDKSICPTLKNDHPHYRNDHSTSQEWPHLHLLPRSQAPASPPRCPREHLSGT